jgi:hypothetical protein
VSEESVITGFSLTQIKMKYEKTAYISKSYDPAYLLLNTHVSRLFIILLKVILFNNEVVFWHSVRKY